MNSDAEKKEKKMASNDLDGKDLKERFELLLKSIPIIAGLVYSTGYFILLSWLRKDSNMASIVVVFSLCACCAYC